MAGKTFLAYFHDIRNADTAAQVFENMIFIVAVKKYEADVPNPDLSVSALMNGYLPNLAHGIYGTDDEYEHAGSYLLIVADEYGHEREIRETVKRYGGSVIKEEG